MGLFSIFTGTNINDGVKKYMETEGASLLDVRLKMNTGAAIYREA